MQLSRSHRKNGTNEKKSIGLCNCTTYTVQPQHNTQKLCGSDAKKIKCKSPSSTSCRQILLFRRTNTLWALGFLWNFHNESNETNHNNKHHDTSMHFDFQCYILCTVMKTSSSTTRREAKHSHESRMFYGEFPLSNWHYKNERTVSRYIILK